MLGDNRTVISVMSFLDAYSNPFVIAEAGVNHNGDIDKAHALIEAAVAAGADAVKFQTFVPEKIAAAAAPMADYQKETVTAQRDQLSMIRDLYLPFSAFIDLKADCDSKGILFLSTPFDHESVDFLDSLDMPFFKISSGELTNSPLLHHIGTKKKPVILSTGMGDLSEIETAMNVLMASGAPSCALLHCLSAYPAPPEQMNLRAMATLEQEFGVVVGLSDHSEGIEIAIAATALGARIIEKHFTLDKSLPGPDHLASLEPDELRRMIIGIRKTACALGDGVKRPAPAEKNVKAVARRSLCAAHDIALGETISADDISILRPGTGMPPDQLETLVGRISAHPITAGHLLTENDFLPVNETST